MFDEGVASACAVRDCAPPILAAGAGQQLYDAVIVLGQRWQALPFHTALTLDMPHLIT